MVLLFDSFFPSLAVFCLFVSMYVGAGFDPPAKLACWLNPRI